MSLVASFKVIDGLREMPGQLLFEPALYNESAFLKLKNYHRLKTFLAMNGDGNIAARIRFAKSEIDSHWVSLPGAPFGGFELIPGFDLTDFLAFIKTHFEDEQEIEIKEPPEIYGGGIASDLQVKFTTVLDELNHHIDLLSNISLHTMERRRLKKSVAARCRFAPLELDAENAITLHKFISKCRESQGLEINIDERTFLASVKSMPSNYKAFTVELEHKIIAATVIVNVTSSIAYNYLPASDRAYHQLSPMVLLMHGLYKELKNNGFGTLDWGVTSINGEEQASLARFKEAMGAVRTTKKILTYGKE